MDTLFIIGRTIDLIGKCMVAVTAILVHHRMLKDKKFDKGVFEEIKHEKLFGFIGLALMILGYVIEVVGLIWS